MSRQISSQISESTPLISNQQNNECTQRRDRLYRHFCLQSKAATLMLFWMATVGIIYYTVVSLTVLLMDFKSESPDISIKIYAFVMYAVLAFVAMTYPLSGLIADVYCGRLKTVGISLFFIAAFPIFLCVLEIFLYVTKLQGLSNLKEHHYESIGTVVLGMVSLIVFIIGLAGYQANFIQLGLDQLFEAPNQYLRLFILYTAWIFRCTSVPFTLLLPLLYCSCQTRRVPLSMLVIIPLITSVTLIILLIISRWKRHWFYIEPGHQNPYKTVFNVIKFAKKHKHPRLSDAVPVPIVMIMYLLGLTLPSRGLEDLSQQNKLKMLKHFSGSLLFCFRSTIIIFYLPIVWLAHAVEYHKHTGQNSCTEGNVLLGTGSFMNIFSTLIVFPVYIWVNISMLCRRMHGFFKRTFNRYNF